MSARVDPQALRLAPGDTADALAHALLMHRLVAIVDAAVPAVVADLARLRADGPVDLDAVVVVATDGSVPGPRGRARPQDAARAMCLGHDCRPAFGPLGESGPGWSEWSRRVAQSGLADYAGEMLSATHRTRLLVACEGRWVLLTADPGTLRRWRDATPEPTPPPARRAA